MIDTIKTDRDAFEYVRTKLLEQNEKAMSPDDTCAYRAHKSETHRRIKEEAKLALIQEFGEIPSNDDLMYTIEQIQAETPFDAMCAVGHLIDNKYYFCDIEGEGLNQDSFRMVVKSNKNWIINRDSDEDSAWSMLVRLQKIHDGFEPDRWEEEFDGINHNFDENGKWIVGVLD